MAEGRHSYCLPTDSLSSREAQICKLLTNGMRLKQVALLLSLSIHTVNSHVRSAYLKLGVHDRGGLVVHFAAPNVVTVRGILGDLIPPQVLDKGKRPVTTAFPRQSEPEILEEWEAGEARKY
jgi:DNA-binding CsgD family transcriptional regulator